MKSIAMVVAATAAVLAVNTSGALSQEACSKAYVGCMDICAERPTKGMQDTCMNSCQTRNNQCSAEVYGSRRETGPAMANQPPAEGKKALAKEVASPPPRNVDVAPRKVDAGARKAEGSMRKVDVPPRRKAAAPMPDKGNEPAQNGAAPSEPVEAQK
jgi:hypothetical protein